MDKMDLLTQWGMKKMILTHSGMDKKGQQSWYKSWL